ncbi:MAG: MarR family winged helix-turn-helix transcriptional regulator [Prevotellaceae bacterium]|jgi:DNA-binding MarR family transcriptional regulator|nr:MarR family winged helix-turn-helix transcriptional regulator [Prevotellaceae bacterium]
MKKKREADDFPFRIRDNDANSGFLLWKTAYVWMYEQKRILMKFHNISQMEYVVLSSTYWLMLHDKEITQIYLSHHTKIEPMGISQLIKALEARGLMERCENAKDSRSKLVKVTEKGIELLKRAIVTTEAFDERFFRVLGKRLDVFNISMLDLIQANE